MENLEKKRHSLAHIMAAAIQELWPEAQLAIGPAIENGFYYDIDFGTVKIIEADLKTIEKKMNHLLKQNLKFTRTEMKIDEAIKEAKKEKHPYKLEILEDLKKEGEKEVSFYSVGTFTDLCRGPHIESTKEIKPNSFKLQKLAGAYWRGDEKNKMLTRIYGLAFNTKEELDEHLRLLSEAEKRDHRKLGKELDLFHIDEIVGLGLPLWHPKGARLWRALENFWYNEHEKAGYELVRSPHIGNKKLWETSGHWGFYNDSMYPPLEAGQSLLDSQEKKVVKESEAYLLKPMNCPFHVQIYKNSLHSYRDLPLRWAECGTVYRYEKKGELSGLTRVRGFTQDDAHIICRADQVEEELSRVVDFILFIYSSFGFKLEDIKVYLSVRDPQNKKTIGTDDGWNFTEKVLEKIAKAKKLNYETDLGGAAFYGPKLDFKIKDVLGREWQCSTLQFDFNLPERFQMSFTNSQGEKEQPFMLHRALFGSFERFIGLLIEHFNGAFPLWLAPVQIKILSVAEKHLAFAEKLATEFKANGFRVEVDHNNETVGNKIRKAVNEKVPYVLVIGDKEMESQDLNVRDRGQQETRTIAKDAFIAELQEKIKNHS
ncbi:MAG: threonine--tRNA ligase [Patescibacteria group bacterium]|jgi:threonyl-tRNA synthetase|nr:threonine--tRNA ligase [bacterium]HQC50103.1 threonine--tRNA ligase [bacterium]